MLQLRHEGHHGHDSTHYINVKYGYINLAVTLGYFALVVFYERRQAMKFNNNLPGTTRFKSLPLAVHFVIWMVLMAAMNASVFREFSWSVLLKRFGRLGYSLVPVNLLLILKPNFINYLILVPVHKWLSRFIVVLASVHSIGFLVKWLLAGELLKAFNIWNFLGVVLFVNFLVLMIISLRKFRTVNYLLFYVIHNLSVVSFVVLITLHARPNVGILTAINLLLLLVNLITKINYCKVAASSVKVVKFKTLGLLKFEKPINYPILLPGSHLRVINTSKGSWLWKSSHPYTIINNHENINLVISTRTKFSDTIMDSTSGSNYLLSYPYSSSFNIINYQQDLIYFVVGGSGISLYLSFINYYQNLNIAFNVNLFWSIKHKQDLKLLDHLNLPSTCLVTVYITRDREQTAESQFDIGSELDLEQDDRDQLLGGNDGEDEGTHEDIQMHTFDKPDEAADKSTQKEFSIHYGRMDISQLTPQPGLLISCGPDSLIDDCERYCTVNNVKLIKEYYRF